ncbi:MAG: alpha/beta fold hydrolase [Spirochaetales bacterium]|nr:alpha/beta fold hydrolase [Spirochaetales bacterium]
MYITDDGIRLNATITMPEGNPSKCPLAIIIHGFTGHSEEPHILAVSDMLNGIGLATLRVDMYGHGKSDGDFKDHTLFKWMNNAMAVIDYALKLPFVTDIYLLGHSQGGLTAILAAALKHDKIKALVPMSPGTMIVDGARKGNILGYEFDPDNLPDELPLRDGEMILGSNYVRVAQTIHVEDAIDRYTGPVLLVHGDEDMTVPVSCSIEAAKRYRNAELVIIHGEDHCYHFHLDRIVDAIRNWMLKQLKK